MQAIRGTARSARGPLLGADNCRRIGGRTGRGVSMLPRITLDVQMTSLKWMFIHESTFTKCPLYVSPDLSSTNCRQAQTTQRQSTAAAVLFGCCMYVASSELACCINPKNAPLDGLVLSAEATGAASVCSQALPGPAVGSTVPAASFQLIRVQLLASKAAVRACDNTNRALNGKRNTERRAAFLGSQITD